MEDIRISRYVDQSKAELIGYQAYYSDGSNKFYENYSDIKEGTGSNPLVDIKQVGKMRKNKTLTTHEDQPISDFAKEVARTVIEDWGSINVDEFIEAFKNEVGRG